MAQNLQKLRRKYHEMLSEHWAVVEVTVVLVSFFSSASFFPILIFMGEGFLAKHTAGFAW